ncbi:MAG: hypothetical protein WC554_19595 [Clostridia bacterium]|jgi:hypothetical protein
MEITYTLKKGTKIILIGSDEKIYRICKCGNIHLNNIKCPLCEAKKETIHLEIENRKEEKIRIRKEKFEKKLAKKQKDKELKEAKKNVKFYILWGHYQKLIEGIKDLINIGLPNEIIMSAFFSERNPPYDLSNAKQDYQIKIQPFGKVLEHVNGRETIGYYCVYAILIGDIKNPQELEQFYLTYCGQIKTDADFNTKVIKPYQNDEGAVSAEMYIEVLEKERNICLTLEEKEYFRSKFLYSKYGKLIKNDVINYLRNGQKTEN